jgi:DNA polymerase
MPRGQRLMVAARPARAENKKAATQGAQRPARRARGLKVDGDGKVHQPILMRDAIAHGKATLDEAARRARRCRACDLWERATQTVFGAGPKHAKLIFVGEQPGDEEDRAGSPFVGPAGRLLDKALEEAGIRRDQTYVTNVVKHFSWEPRGKWRIHKKPKPYQIRACRPWLEAEILALKPRVLVCLGATAAQALLGNSFRVTQSRGRFVPSELAARVMATIHPSAVLRAPDDEARHREYAHLVADLKVAAGALQ